MTPKPFKLLAQLKWPSRVRLTQAVAAMGLFLIALITWFVYSLSAVGGSKVKAILIRKGQTVPQIAAQLEEAKLIRSSTAFEWYVTLTLKRARLQAGNYELSPSRSAVALAGIIARGEVTKNLLVIPEGLTISKIRELAAENGISPTDFNAALEASRLHPALKEKPSDVSLEGYLFPDTYHLDSQDTARGLVTSMLDNFQAKVGQKYAQAFASRGLSLHQGLTLASIVEREVPDRESRRKVAQVFYKRLSIQKPLESDITVEYAAEVLGTEFNLALESPYNTYRNRGLPPGPVCNPGLDALEAAINSASTDYLYFVSGKDGKTYFSKTFEEHQALVKKYL